MEFEVTGTLRWNDFEGGFWSLEPDGDGSTLMLGDWRPAEPIGDGSRIRARVRAHEDAMSFQMAGTPAEVLDVRPA